MNVSKPHVLQPGRRRFVQLLVSLPLVPAAALAHGLSPSPSGTAMTTAHDTIRPKALVFDMQGTVFNFYDPMMHELARLPAVAPRLQDWSTFPGRWSAAAHGRTTGPKEGDMSITATGTPAHTTSSLEFNCLSTRFTKTSTRSSTPV